jgi:hypothetical protein
VPRPVPALYITAAALLALVLAAVALLQPAALAGPVLHVCYVCPAPALSVVFVCHAHRICTHRHRALCVIVVAPAQMYVAVSS